MKKLILGLICILALGACKQEKQPPKNNKDAPVIKIGAIVPLTTDGAVLGASMKAGILAAIEDKSKENLKYRYELILEDNQMLPSKSALAAQKLIRADHVDMLLTFTTGSGRVVAPIAQNEKVLHVCATLEDENAAPMGTTTFFQGPTVQSYHKLMLKALQKNHVQKLALLAANIGVACSGTTELAKVLKQNGMDVKVECFNPSDRDFRFVVRNYILDGFENFYIQFFPPQTDIIIRQLKDNQIPPEHIFGSDIDTGTDVSLFEGINHFGGNSGTSHFINRLMEEYKIDNVYMAATAYDLTTLAIDAFENAQDPKNIYDLVGYFRARATRKCMSGDCKLLNNGFIANEAEWRTYKNGKPVIFRD